jgi:hypothetical protein
MMLMGILLRWFDTALKSSEPESFSSFELQGNRSPRFE